MLERPELSDAAIQTGLDTHYDLRADRIEFLPIGHDSYAWVFRVESDDGRAYFLKVRRGEINGPGLVVPHFLQTQGISQVIAPLATRTGALWAELEPFRLILYPFVAGESGMTGGMTDDQWVEYGAILRRVHTVTPSPELSAQMKRETFALHPKWSGIVRTLLAEIGTRDYTDPYARELGAFLRERRAEIANIVARAEALGRELQQRSLAFVLCHADIHTANVLVDVDGEIHFVDWDETMLAPKERDLMFIVGSRVASVVELHEEKLFLRGYGATEIDTLALSYYRYEWAVQEVGAFSEPVFLQPEVGEETRAEAVRLLMGEFAPGGIVDVAYGTDAKGR